MENNSNDVILDFDANFEMACYEAEQSVPKDMMEICNSMPMFPQGYPTIEAESTPVPQVLNDVNAELYREEEEEEESNCLDLDLLKSLGSNQAEMEWDQEENGDLHNASLHQAQEPVVMFHAELMPMQFESLPTPLSDTKSSLGSPLSQELNDDPYWIPSLELERISNNANGPTRSRKMSYKSDKSITKERQYRPRATKADMESMTEMERIQRKKVQNKANARKCVQKKNNEKSELAACVEDLNKQKEMYQKVPEHEIKNILEIYVNRIWPQFNNNSPYGSPTEFHDLLDAKMDTVSASIDQKNAPELKKLEKEFEIAQKNYDEVIEKGKNGIPANTFASKKSRANTSLTIAKLRYEKGLFQTSIDQILAMISALNEFIRELNQWCRRFLRCEPLAELVVLKNNEPS